MHDKLGNRSNYAINKQNISYLKQRQIIIFVKLLAKSKLKSLPYNHTDHPPTTRNFKSSLNKSIQVLHQHMIHFWNP